jgi:hypothetical protein
VPELAAERDPARLERLDRRLAAQQRRLHEETSHQLVAVPAARQSRPSQAEGRDFRAHDGELLLDQPRRVLRAQAYGQDQPHVESRRAASGSAPSTRGATDRAGPARSA